MNAMTKHYFDYPMLGYWKLFTADAASEILTHNVNSILIIEILVSGGN